MANTDKPQSLPRIADALSRIATALEAWVEAQYPTPKPKRPVTVAIAKYKREEDENPETTGAVFPDVIGPREARILARQQKQARRSS